MNDFEVITPEEKRKLEAEIRSWKAKYKDLEKEAVCIEENALAEYRKRERLLTILREPDIDVYDAVRGFLLHLNLTTHLTYENAKKHAELNGDSWPQWLEGRTGYITKSEQAEIVYQLCLEKILKKYEEEEDYENAPR